MNQNNLLILERSSSTLVSDSKNGEYVLEGIFGEIDKKNKNNRIYTESEYVPQIEALQEKIKSSKLLGELDHPAKFDISLKNVSHVIEDLFYDKETKQVKGKIRLLDTDAGKQAKALVDAGVPLQISSRAAGAVESNGQVKIKQLFTYDLVADPGFENAQLNRVNESYGLSNDSNISIFEINEEGMVTETETIETENKIENTIMENQARFVSVEDFNKYSAYLAEEIKTLKESLANDSTNDIEEKVNALTNYVEYVAERADKGIQYTEYVAENLDKNIDQANQVAEKLDESIAYTEHVAESASKIKEYTNYLAESMNEGATDYENVTKYLNYLKENVESISEYADYIAETINTNLIVEGGEEAGIEAEDMKDELKDETPEVIDADGEEYAKAEDRAEDKSDELEDEIVDGEDGAKEVAESEQDEVAEEEAAEEVEETEEVVAEEEAEEEVEETEEVEESAEGAKDVEEIEGEEVEAGDNSKEGNVDGEEAGVEAEDIKADHKEVNSEDDKGIVDAADKDMPSEEDAMTESEEDEEVDSEIAEEEAEEVEETVDAVEAYKNEISEKLSALINKATVVENNNPHFFKFVSEATQNKYNELEEADKSKVLANVEGRGYLTESQINILMESALVEVAGQTAPYFIEVMPSEYKDTWAKLSEAKKSAITAQAKMVKLSSPYQVKNFWDTRDLREVAQVMEKVEMVSESKVTEEKASTITYNVDGMAEAFAKRFNK